VPLPVHYCRDDDSKMLLELMVQYMGKQVDFEKDNKRGPVKNFETDFPKRLSDEFNQTYSSKQVAIRMRAPKKKCDIVHERVSSMRPNSDANDVKLESCIANLQKMAVAERREAEPTTGRRNEVRLAVRQATTELLAESCRQ